MAISGAHQGFLAAHAVDVKLARRLGVHSVPGALVYPWRSLDGSIVEQRYPDEPEGDAKYLWPAGKPLTFNCLDRPALRDPTQRLYLIEGTKQHLAAASADPDLAIIGMVGCWGWSIGDGVPNPDLGVLVTAGAK